MDRRKLLLLRAALGAGTSAETLTVTGASPLSLVNAIYHAILSLTQEGKCAQSGTPSQNNYVPIKCNNGEIKCSPNLLDSSAANTVLGYYINKADGVVKDSPYNFYFDTYMPVIPGETYVAYGRSKDGSDLSDYNRVAWYDSNKDWLSGASYTQNQIAVVTAPSGAAYARFSCNPSGGTTTPVTQAIVDGFNWVFQRGSSEPSVVHPYKEIYVDGTPEVLSLFGKNLFDKSVGGKNLYMNNNTNAVITDGTCMVFEVPIGATITISGTNGNRSLLGYTDSPASDVVSGFVLDGRLADGRLPRTFTAEHRTYVYYANSSYAPTLFDDFQVEIGSGATDYASYVTPQTASVVNLLSLPGGRKDFQEIISGVVTRRCRVIVFDGTENWYQSGSNPNKVYLQVPRNGRPALPDAAPFCTYYKPAETATWGGLAIGECLFEGDDGGSYSYDFFTDGLDKNGFKAFLREKYAAGTPLMMVVPQAETTEQVTPQPLNTSAGTNTVSVTAEVSGITLTAEYKGTA